MKKQVSSSKINGTLDAPPSKSVMIRAVAASLLASGTSRIINPSFCNDAESAMAIADMFGAEVVTEKTNVMIKGNGDLREKEIKGNVLDCGESGLCMRMFAPIAGLLEKEVVLTASGSLMFRPMKMIEGLMGLGVTCTTKGGYAPIRVKGRIGSGTLHVSGSESSQFLTGLLMALPLCPGDSTIIVSDLKSKPYIELTIDVMEKFGVTIQHNRDLTDFHIKGNQHYAPQTYSVEGDWSGAAFFLVAGALAGSATVKGLNLGSYQADKAILNALIQAGAQVETGVDSVSVKKDGLHAFNFDASDCPDLFPPLAALAGGCEGKSVIYGVERLKHKESDRAIALAREFFKLGVGIDVYEDKMEVTGNKVRWGRVDSHNDHRIAMACAITALKGDTGVEIENAECVSKSYPSFFETLDSIRVADERLR